MANVNREHAKRHSGRRISENKGMQHMENNNPTGSSTRRKLSMGNATWNIRDAAGLQMDQIQVWPNNSIVSTIQQLEDSMQVNGNVQNLLDVLDGRNQRMTTVARRGNGELQRRDEANDRERRLRRRYEFCKKARGDSQQNGCANTIFRAACSS